MIWKILGSLFLLKVGITLAQFKWLMLKLYVLPLIGIKNNLKKHGSWAVVTGATDGIGKAVAKELAKCGLNIVLISRTEEKLKAVADEFASLNVKIKTIQYDFSNVDGYGKLKEELKDLDIGILVNNVGISYVYPEYFMDVDAELIRKMMNVNITSVLEMTRIVMKGMIERKQGGMVIHVSSSSSLSITPLLSAYGASKSFVNLFSQGLSYEYEKLGIKHHVITPYFVATSMSKMRASGIFVPSADVFAKQMVKSFGLAKISTGYWSHDLLFFILSLLPKSLLAKQALGMMQSTRKRYLKKQSQKKD